MSDEPDITFEAISEALEQLWTEGTREIKARDVAEKMGTNNTTTVGSVLWAAYAVQDEDSKEDLIHSFTLDGLGKENGANVYRLSKRTDSSFDS